MKTGDFLNTAVLTVSQLNKYVKLLLDSDKGLNSLFISGEISNFKINSFSGHIYFSLKDESAAVRCVMFKSSAARLKFMPEEGMKVICRGGVTVYERDGQYQLYVNDMQPDGAGSIAIAFEQLKKKLASEGLFDAAKKRPLPKFPKTVAVITSETGAAVRDIINILGRRWQMANVLLCPVSVQGDNAAPQMISALKYVNDNRLSDVIIIGRGGGSAEDLWCFNDELLARAVVASAIPVISAVGHETDFTICDFAADLRAPTPSAAAELAVPDGREIRSVITGIDDRMTLAVCQKVGACHDRLNSAVSGRTWNNILSFFSEPSLRLDNVKNKLDHAFGQLFTDDTSKLALLMSKLDALDPMKILFRGFSVVKKRDAVVKSVGELNQGDRLVVNFSDGTADCIEQSTERTN